MIKLRMALTVLIVAVLVACTSTDIATVPASVSTKFIEQTSTIAAQTTTPTPTVSPTNSPVPTPSRAASISQIENLVEARISADAEFSPASTGQMFEIGGQARTGENSRARIDLLPDATIIRLAPTSLFTLAALEKRDGNPFTRLKLTFGKIFIILNGGSLDVETPSGVASVRGSMMSVSFDPTSKAMTVTCLEGHCSLRKDNAILDLVGGQAADILNGILARNPRDLTDTELYDWIDNAPELKDLPGLVANLRDRLDKLRQRPPRWP
jgi:ferric-dicitrate binding protein FerR (iron transport regulator)